MPECYTSCGFASSGLRVGHIGQCCPTKSCAAGFNKIFLFPTLDDPIAVLDPLVHAVDYCEYAHGIAFKK